MSKKSFTRITVYLLLLCAIITPVSAYAITYYVRFNPNGGSGTMSNQTFSTDEEKYLSTNTFTRTGYSFIGWNSNSAGTGTWYMPSKKVKNLSSTNGATVDVYAQWINSNQSTITSGGSELTKDSGGNYNIDNLKKYTVQVNLVGGTVDQSSKSFEYHTNGTFTVTPTTGYWNPTVSCTNGQSGSISGSTLTVTNISNDSVCTVTFQKHEYTATFYYQSSTASGTTTVSSTTETCTVTTGTSCEVDIPSAVLNSGGTYNNAYLGLATSTGTMETGKDADDVDLEGVSSFIINRDSSYYALYRTTYNIYYPVSEESTISMSVYQNQWFTSNSAMATTVLSTSETGKTTNAAAGSTPSGYSVEGFGWANYAPFTDSITYFVTYNPSRASQREFVQVDKKEETIEATFYYNNNSTCGGTTFESATSSGTRTTRLLVNYNHAVTKEVNNGKISVPSEVSQPNQGKYNSYLQGLASSPNSLESAKDLVMYSGVAQEVTTEFNKYYAFYRASVNVYYPVSTEASEATTYYRNEFFTNESGTQMASVLSTNNKATDNDTYTSSMNGYTLEGFYNTAASYYGVTWYSNGEEHLYRNYETISELAESCTTTTYGILSTPGTSTILYSSSSSGTKASTTLTGKKYLRANGTNVYAFSGRAGTFDASDEVAPYGTSFLGYYLTNESYVPRYSGFSTYSYCEIGLVCIREYYQDVYNYYYSTSAYSGTGGYSNQHLYRHSFLSSPGSDSTYTAILGTAKTSRTNYTPSTTGIGGSTWIGYGTNYPTVASAAESTVTWLYDAYQLNVVYEKGSNVSSIGATSGSCVLYSEIGGGDENCQVTLPAITPNSGYTPVGWSTASGATTGTAAGSNYTISTNNTKLYANAKAGTNYTISYSLNGGNNPGNPTNYNAASLPITLAKPTKTLTFKGNPNSAPAANAPSSAIEIGSNTSKAQTFAGWTGSNGSTNQTSVTLSTGTTGNKSYTAHWTAVAGTLPTVTRPGHVCGWATSDNSTTIVYASGGTYPASAITESMNQAVNLYAVCTPNQYTIQVNITNGTITGSASQTVNYGTNATFSLNPDSSVLSPTVSCTNSQAASISSSNTLTVGPVTNNATCSVVYSATYKITFNKGNYSGATNLPGEQTKAYGQSIDLSNTTPNNGDNYTFLGWATTQNATASSGTWYDGGQSYSANSNLTLYAQWYDVQALEQWYTTIVRAGTGTDEYDFIQSPSADDEQATTVGSGVTFNTPYQSGNNPGFYYIEVSGFYTAGWLRPLVLGGFDKIIAYDIRNNNDGTARKYYRLIRNRAAQTYPSDTVDTRIDRLQKIQDVGVRYKGDSGQDIKVKESVISNITLNNTNPWYENVQTGNVNINPDSGYKFIMAAGYRLAGTNSNRVFVYQDYCDATSGHVAVAKTISSVNPTVSLYSYFVEVKQKTARSTTFSPNTSSAKGLQRYNALKALDDTKGNYFPGSYVQTAYYETDRTISAWGTGGQEHELTLQDGKILGPIAFNIFNASSGGKNRNRCYMTSHYVDSDEDGMYFHQFAASGNSKYTETTGVEAKVNLYSGIVYISPTVNGLQGNSQQ